MPAAFGRIEKNSELIKQTILETDENVLREYWNVTKLRDDRIKQWCELVAVAAEEEIGSEETLNMLENIFSKG